MEKWQQVPPPGGRITCSCGDVLTITLIAPSNAPKGAAWLRSNIGGAQAHRTEIIAHTEQYAPLLAGDWHDYPMPPAATTTPNDATCFTIQLLIHQPGIFEAKAFFLPEGSTQPCWPEGPNLHIKTLPAITFAANTIYTAFVRQFGPNRQTHPAPPLPDHELAALDAEGWTLIPQSGTFRDLANELDHIIGTLGFRIIQLLPVHPVPTTFARMGRFGSPFASIDFFNVDRALAEFDRSSTPLQQFGELVDAIHQRNARIFLDLPINHTGWASQLQVHHPEWFTRNEDHTFASPGAWGVVWEDLSELDYQHRDLWHYMADVFLFWCQRGVDGFRCDAGYMIPLPVWEYIVAKVRTAYPETIFLLEGLGGRISTTQALLAEAGLDWAYSEIFQVHDRAALEQQIRHDHTSARTHGALMHFAETHDNNRLAATSQLYARMRTALAALTADSGTFGITSGVEWFATEKVDVHGAPSLNWGAPENQLEWIQRINTILKSHPAFYHGATLEIVNSYTAVLQVLRTSACGAQALILVNLDTATPAHARWHQTKLHADTENPLFDLLTEQPVQLQREGEEYTCMIPPGGACCLAPQRYDVPNNIDPITLQRAKSLALSQYCHWHNASVAQAINPEQLAHELLADPAAFCARISAEPEQAVLTRWNPTKDVRRIVMLPSRHAILITAQAPFRVTLSAHATICSICTESLPQQDKISHFAILIPNPDFPDAALLDLHLTLFTPDQTQHIHANVQRLGGDSAPRIRLRYEREHLRNSRACAILANDCGAISQVRLEWGRIESQYDALLAANLHPKVPVDRHILFTRCRAWLVNKGYSHKITLDCTRHVQLIPGQKVIWHFDTPAGMGRTVPLQFTLSWLRGRNHIQLQIARDKRTNTNTELADDEPIQIILRPDIEDRSCHCATKAYAGPEHNWPAAIATEPDGFLFTPGPHANLHIQIPMATFTSQPEWLYTQPHPFEAERGLEPNGDLFSPGFFTVPLQGGELRELAASVPGTDNPTAITTTDQNHTHETRDDAPLEHILQSAIRDFVVRRDDARTVIAGYPWFLDWGRDTLICLRGMIAAGMIESSRDILKQFARFEQQGTIPNMIRGTDDRDRDTSDAPLWLFTACRDIIKHTGDHDILKMDCGGRPLRAILQSLATHYMHGTPNGIKMDAASGLIYSPSHFTWMDTNYPAGTPRQGYPIEIQALWYAALHFLTEIDADNPLWQKCATTVQDSILRLYRIPQTNGGLSDCLHATPDQPADQATPDNAIRPNQLLAITLGAVTDPVAIADILRETACLLIPGAIRSLADQPVIPPLPVYGPFGLLNNPELPYQGQYGGDEDTRRKPAYHNGTAWTWPFPSYCEALAIHDRKKLTPAARELLYSMAPLLQTGCIGHLPEILDGDTPHAQRGCWAQAWGVTEAYRVLALLNTL